MARQSPQARARIRQGRAVTLTLYRYLASKPPPRKPVPTPRPVLTPRPPPPPASAGQVSVPGVINQILGTAQKTLRSRGLGYRVGGYVNTPNRGLHNRVARQNPPPNAAVRRRTAVSLTLYRFAAPRPPSPPAPPAVVTVPNLANQPLATALARLGRAGLIPGSTTWQSTRNSALSLRVRSQSPRANSRVRRGSAVQVRVYWLASPPPARTRPPAPPVVRRPPAPPPVPQVTVPDVLRQPYGTAENILRAKKLNVRVAGYIHTSNRALRYRVLRQSPAPNARTRRGNVVSLTLYRYSAATPPSPPPFRVIVPSVIRQPYVIATDILRTRGLGARVVGYTSTPNRDLHGWVQQQSPAPRTRTNRGDRIRLWLYRFVQ